MKRTVRAISIVSAAMVAITTLLSGCGGGKQSEKETPAASTAAADSKTSYLNSTGFPIVKQPVTLKMMAKKNVQHGEWQNMMVLQEYEKMTGMKVDYEVSPAQGFDEKMNLVFAANELPDAFIMCGISASDQLKYGTTGQLIPIESLIEKYGPNFKALLDKYPDAKKTITAPGGGHIYAMAGIVTINAALTQKMWIHGDLLKKANVKVPETTEDMYKVLQAFKAADSTVAPISGAFTDVQPLNHDTTKTLEAIWRLGRQFGTFANVENDKVKMWLDDDKYRNLLEYMNKLYREKLLDPEIFTLDMPKYTAKKKASKVGINFEQADGFMDAKVYQSAAYPKGPYGDPVLNCGTTARDIGAFAISSTCKYPEAALRWVDYFYGDAGSIFLRYGMEGKTYTKKADGMPEYLESIMKDPRGYAVTIGQFTIWPGAGAPHWINEKNSSAVTSTATLEAQKKIDPFMPKVNYGPLIMPKDIADKYIPLNSDITKFANESFSRFVTEGVTDAKWNEYKATIQKMGLRDLEAMYQKALDGK